MTMVVRLAARSAVDRMRIVEVDRPLAARSAQRQRVVDTMRLLWRRRHLDASFDASFRGVSNPDVNSMRSLNTQRIRNDQIVGCCFGRVALGPAIGFAPWPYAVGGQPSPLVAVVTCVARTNTAHIDQQP